MYLSVDSKFYFQCKKKTASNRRVYVYIIWIRIRIQNTYLYTWNMKQSKAKKPHQTIRNLCIHGIFFFSFLILLPFVVSECGWLVESGGTIFLSFKIHHFNRNISFVISFRRPLFFELKMIVSYPIMSSICGKRR